MQHCGWDSAAQHHIVQSWGTEAGLHPQFILCTARDIPALLSLTHMPPPSQFDAVTSGEKPICASIHWLSCVRLFATPWIAARQSSLSITNSRSPPKPMSIELVMPSNHLILCHPLLLLPSIFPSIRVFSGVQSIGISASTSVLPMNTQY